MKAVNSRELFCKGEGHAVVVGGRAGDAADDFVVAEAAKELVDTFGARPHQLASMAIWTRGWRSIAVVHSTVCILAIRAALMRRAVW